MRDRLAAGPVFAGSCYDCLTSRLVEDAGFEALYISGAGVAISRLGIPDLGLITQTEMVDVARRIIARAGVPVISDIDTGYGGVLNVARTIEEFGAAGVAAVHMEDQVFPKRCGHLRGKAVIDLEEYLSKVRAADRARADSGMILIARIDAIAVEGIRAAIERGNRALAAGADMVFVEAPSSIEEIHAIATRIEGRTVFNLLAGGISPSLTFDELAELGFDLVIVPPVAVSTAVQAVRTMAKRVVEARSDQPLRELGLEANELFELFGLSEWLALDEYASGATP
jgi:2-methylisocitrate lyase-like PEP mutase family enzyme